MYWAAHLLVGRDFACLLLELASSNSQLAKLPTAKAGLATPVVFSEKNLTLQADGLHSIELPLIKGNELGRCTKRDARKHLV